MKSNLMKQFVWAVVFGLLAWVSIVLFLRIFAPPTFVQPAQFVRDYDRGAMVGALAPEVVRERLTAIEELGSRAPSQPGHVAMYQMLKEVTYLNSSGVP